MATELNSIRYGNEKLDINEPVEILVEDPVSGMNRWLLTTASQLREGYFYRSKDNLSDNAIKTLKSLNT